MKPLRRASPRSALVLGAMVLCSTACRNGNDGPASGGNLLDDADLVALELSAGELSLAFDRDTKDYSVDTLSGVGTTSVTATTSDAGATLEVGGFPAISGTPFGPFTLAFGTTSIAVVVTAEDGITTKTYAVTVRRPHFEVASLSVPEGATWQVNRPMVFEFNEPIDFSTLSANTIEIRSLSGVPAIGVFELRDERTIVFQPRCPLSEDLSDSGLAPGLVAHTIRIPGHDQATNTLRSASGGQLETTVVRDFVTPDFGEAFLDAKAGPPAPIVRAQGSLEEGATHLLVGLGERVFFERDANQELVLSVPGFESPLHLYSDPSTSVAVVIAFDQPILPTSANLSADRLRLEFLDAGTWRPLVTRTTMLANCAGTGALVRLDPIAILPQATEIRAVIGAGFEDLVGEASLLAIDDFARVPTEVVDFTSLTPADRESDEILEGFDLGGPGSLEDTDSVLDLPRAEWGEGRLTAAADFGGTGGPNGDFDWEVRTGETFVFDTTESVIFGGPDGARDTFVDSTGGIVDLRNFTIEEGGTVRVQGPNPMRILATGAVRIAGRLDLSGFSANDVATLDTGNVVESGAAGAAGGGSGGNANDNTRGPTPRGGRGQGAFGMAGGGGEGGEMGVSPNPSKNARRPGGGGGGRFTRDWIGTTVFADVSLAATPGTNGNSFGQGAESGSTPPAGGRPGSGPFVDADAGNDFFGDRPVVTNGEITALVRGELPSLWAGAGGGGGGNAGTAFPPNPSWNFASDEKGGAGGGGGGGLLIKALGRIVFGRAGAIVSNGGRGATGENIVSLDHIGGTGGGGSGGHVVLESAVAVDFTDGGLNVGSALRDFVLAAGPTRRTGPLEFVDTCGVSPLCCPFGCEVNSNGGAGGGGLIQIHVPDPTKPPASDPTADIVVPSAAELAPDILDQLTSPPAYVMMPTVFAARLAARSKWISIGEADRRPDGSRGALMFLFGGVETSGAGDGRIQTNGPLVPERPPLLEGALEGSSTVSILPDRITLSFRGSALEPLVTGSTSGVSNDLYLRTPALLREFVLRIEAETSAGDFVVADATYDEGGAAPGDEELRVTVAQDATGTPRSFFDRHVADPGILAYRMIPRFFRVLTSATENLLPSSSFVRIRFQGAGANALGGADEANPLVDWTGDVSRFQTLEPGALRFFRFQVEFDPVTQPVTIDFLRIPFVF